MAASRVELPFSKMHGLGNDFAVVDARTAEAALDADAIRAMGDRHTGIGFDQLLTVEPARDASCAFYYGIWNADGSPSGQCGNGVRCIAAWLHRAGALPAGQAVRLQSPSGPVTVRLVDAATVAVDMGPPQFAPAQVSFQAEAEADGYALEVDGTTLTIGAVSMGNPHAVLEVEDLEAPRLERWGPAVTGHPRFPEGCNTGFAQVLAPDRIRLRVHERGAGWTRACGTGACAAMAVLHRRGRVGSRVQVLLPGGPLQIDWAGPGHALWMTGAAAFAYEGRWPLVTTTR